NPGVNLEDRVRLLLSSGYASYKLEKWPEALEVYQQLLVLKPNRLDALIRGAHCYLSLGRADEAVASFQETATALTQRGHDLVVQSRFEVALAYYRHALAIQVYRVQKQGPTEFASALAASHLNIAKTQLLQ